jgi:hypothetical protein
VLLLLPTLTDLLRPALVNIIQVATLLLLAAQELLVWVHMKPRSIIIRHKILLVLVIPLSLAPRLQPARHIIRIIKDTMIDRSRLKSTIMVVTLLSLAAQELLVSVRMKPRSTIINKIPLVLDPQPILMHHTTHITMDIMTDNNKLKSTILVVTQAWPALEPQELTKLSAITATPHSHQLSQAPLPASRRAPAIQPSQAKIPQPVLVTTTAEMLASWVQEALVPMKLRSISATIILPTRAPPPKAQAQRA